MGLFSQPAIGLDVSDHSIEAVLIEKKRGVPTLVSYGRMVIPAGIVVNGYVERREELAVMIRKLLADGMTPALSKKAKRVVLAFPESRVFSHVFKVPRIADDKRLGDTLSHEADAFFPYSHEELVPAYAVIDTKPDTKEVYYAAVHRETVKSYLALLHQANLQPVAAESESTAMARALLLPTERQPVVIADIGARTTDLSVFDARGTQFSETLDIAGDHFTSVVADALGITFEEAEEVKKTNGLGGLRQPKAAEALNEAVDALCADVRRAIDFYERRSGRQISRILLAGGSSLMPGLIEHVAGKMVFEDREIRVQLGDPWLGLKVDPVPEKLGVHRRGVVMATAIGLGLRGAKVKKFSEVDFLEAGGHLLEEISPTKRKKKRKKGLGGYSPWVLAGLGFLLFILTTLATWYLAYRFYVRPQAESPLGALPSDSVPPAVAVAYEAALGPQFSPEQNLLKAFPIEVMASAVRTFETEAVPVQGVAEGQVVIVNETANSQPLVATTRLLSESGVLFRLRDRVTVPAGGSVRAAVYADQAGAEGDIGPSRFTIPGLAPALQDDIYATSEAPMSGGVTYEGEPVPQREIDLAVNELAAEARTRLLEEARAKAEAEFYVLESLLGEPVMTVLQAPEAGEASGNYVIEVRVTATLLGVSRDEVEALARTAFAAENPDLAFDELIGVGIDAVESDVPAGTASLVVTGRVVPE